MAVVGVGDLGGFLYEPDGAVIRAGLVTAVAAGVNGRLLDRKIAYVTSDESFRTPFAWSYRVLEELPYREKQLRAALRARGIGVLTIKKRGVEVSPEQLRRRLDLHGEGSATLVLTRRSGHGSRASRRAVLSVDRSSGIGHAGTGYAGGLNGRARDDAVVADAGVVRPVVRVVRQRRLTRAAHVAHDRAGWHSPGTPDRRWRS